MRLVLDTNIVASALLWGGRPHLLLQAARARRLQLFTSAPLLADILGRRKFEKKIAAAQLSIDQIVDRYAQLASLVRPLPLVRVVPDPDDDVVIGTALAATADFIVTGDRRLLGVAEHAGVRIVGVADGVQAIGLS